jgi:hypothetical protein
MDRAVFSCIVVALLVLGVCMVLWTEWAALKSRDDEDRRPPTAREIWALRLLGVGVVAGGAYALYAIVTGMPGADFSGV